MKSILTKLVLVVSVIATSQAAIASDFEVDGIGYDIVSAADLTCSLTDGKNANGDIIIPEKVSYKSKELTVISIGEKAFYESKITSVIIQGSVTSIGNDAFRGCSTLASVYIPSSVTSIQSNAFYGCSSLASVSIPNSVTSIQSKTFYDCSSLVSVSIPNSVTEIDTAAFRYCTSLESVVIPDSVTKISYDAFSGCSRLESVSIPNSVAEINSGAFSDCASLESVVIPNSITKISDHAFSGCSRLESVSIPNSVTEIDNGAFANSSENLCIVIPYSVTKIGANAFTSIKELIIADGNDEGIDIKTYFYWIYFGISKGVYIYRPFNTNQLYIGRNLYLDTPDDSDKTYYPMSPFTANLERLIIGGYATGLSKDFGWDNAFYPSGNRDTKNKYTCYLEYLEIKKGVEELSLDFDIKSEKELEVVINRKIKGTTIIRPDILKFGDDLTDIFSSQNFDFSRLKNVTFGKSMSDLPSNCLKGNQITTIYMRNPQPPTYTGSIPQATYTDATLYVPKGALEAYQTAEPWKTFWDIQEIDMDSGLDDIIINTNKAKPDVCVDGNLMRIHNADGMSVSVYNPDGSQVWQTDSYTGDAIELHPGMHIVRVGNRAIKLAI